MIWVTTMTIQQQLNHAAIKSDRIICMVMPYFRRGSESGDRGNFFSSLVVVA